MGTTNIKLGAHSIPRESKRNDCCFDCQPDYITWILCMSFFLRLLDDDEDDEDVG